MNSFDRSSQLKEFRTTRRPLVGGVGARPQLGRLTAKARAGRASPRIDWLSLRQSVRRRDHGEGRRRALSDRSARSERGARVHDSGPRGC